MFPALQKPVYHTALPADQIASLHTRPLSPERVTPIPSASVVNWQQQVQSDARVIRSDFYYGSPQVHWRAPQPLQRAPRVRSDNGRSASPTFRGRSRLPGDVVARARARSASPTQSRSAMRRVYIGTTRGMVGAVTSVADVGYHLAIKPVCGVLGVVGRFSYSMADVGREYVAEPLAEVAGIGPEKHHFPLSRLNASPSVTPFLSDVSGKLVIDPLYGASTVVGELAYDTARVGNDYVVQPCRWVLGSAVVAMGSGLRLLGSGLQWLGAAVDDT
eukprot:TRINITY_DN29932_c0_g1_i1.p1 TRINITY_DN29932_c0_g1~~TRINITY_DN29932_c0_g1_i1.p1  ORF type:complete len:283 (-),score=27.53 TRINITY_DN29932_c0_g1_i1:31-852(-)